MCKKKYNPILLLTFPPELPLEDTRNSLPNTFPPNKKKKYTLFKNTTPKQHSPPKKYL